MNLVYNRNQIEVNEEKPFKDFGTTKISVNNSNILKNSKNVINKKQLENKSQNNYIKIDLNNYKNKIKKVPKSSNNIPYKKNIEIINVDLNEIQPIKKINSFQNNNNMKENENGKNNLNKNIKINNNRGVLKRKGHKSKIKYQKVKLFRDDDNGNLSTGIDNIHFTNNSKEIEIKKNITDEEHNIKNNINCLTNRSNNTNSNISQSKSVDISNKDDILVKNNNNNYRKIINNKNNINQNYDNISKTERNIEPRDNYYKNIDMNKINKINKIEQISNMNKKNNNLNNEERINKNENKKNINVGNSYNYKQTEVIFNNRKIIKKFNHNNNLYLEENKENDIILRQNKRKNDNKEEFNIRNSEIFNIEKSSDYFSPNKEKNENNDNYLLNSNNSSVEEKFIYDKNSLKNKKDEININKDYLNKYINNNFDYKANNNKIIKEKINKNQNLKNNEIINNKNQKDNKLINSQIKENKENKIISISNKPKINYIELKNKEEQNISKNESQGSLKNAHNSNNKNKEENISEKSSSINIKNNKDSFSFQKKNKFFMNPKENRNLNIIGININLNKKDSINDNQMEESSNYNMNFYDSRNINTINSNFYSSNSSNKNILKKNKNDKFEIRIDNISSINNSSNYNNAYNNYYNSLSNSNKDSNNESNNIKNEKEFINLMPNKTFKKFLTSKIKYYMNEDSIPKKFISEFISERNNMIKKSKNINFNNINLNIFDDKNKYKKNLFENINLGVLTEPNADKNNEYENINNKYTKKKQLLKEQYEIKKSLLLNQNKELINKINKLQEFIDHSKNEVVQRDKEIKKYLSTYDKISSENELNKKKIENLVYELNAKKNEVEEKKRKINELNNINNNLENKMNILKKEYINEAIINKETKDNYVIIKNNYNDIKNQYDLLNIKYQTLSDENYNFRRDKILYEKEIKTKNLMIEDLLQSNTSIKQKELKEKLSILGLNKIEENENEIYFDLKENKNKDNNDNKDENNNNPKVEEIVINKAKDEDKHKFDKYGMEELINKRDELMKDRKNATNEYYKIPTKANSSQIKKRNELEIKLDQINNDLAKIRIRINILKNTKK